MLRLKGQTESGEWVEFWVYDIINNDKTWTGVWCVSPSRPDEWIKYDDIVTATIQPADDKCECPFCGKSWKPFKVELGKEEGE